MNKNQMSETRSVVFTVYCQLCAREKLERVHPMEFARHEIGWMQKNDCCVKCAIRMNAFRKTYPQTRSDY